MSLDGAKIEVIRSYLTSAAQEMRRTLIRTAFNPVIYEALDFGISVYDADLDLIADAPGLAYFLGANDHAIRKGVAYVGVENLDPGDIVIMNYPYWSSAHAMDATLFSPVFAPDANRPFAFICVRAHWMDLGAKDAGYVLDSTDMHQEGLIFPGTKIYRRGEPSKEIIELVRFNSRMPDLVIGDLDAQVAAIKTGAARLNAIREKFGAETLGEALARIKEYGESLVRKALAELPHGCWEADDIVDDDGVSDTPIPLHVKVTIDETGLTCDFSGSSGAVRGPINIPLGLTETICKFVLKSLTTPHAPSNAGMFRPLTVIAPPGNLFHAVYPSATFTQWTAHIALELVYKALSLGMPERIAACSGGDMLGFMMVGVDQRTGKLYAVSNGDPVGWGGCAQHDGVNAASHISVSLVRNTPVEVMEMKTGMFMENCEMRRDSGAAGEHRGGLGVDREISFRSEGDFLTITKRSKEPPWALLGGEQPEANHVVLFLGAEREARVGTKRVAVKAGDRALVRSAGGAGYGAARRRAPEAVLEDVLDGHVSEQAARTSYLVEIRDGVLDLEATHALRAAADAKTAT